MEPKLLIVDLEATCVDKNAPEFEIAPDEHEIIEIGAVLYDPDLDKIIDSFQAFVRPVIHPSLSSFCTLLTSIQQEDVDTAGEFKDVIAQFDLWVRSSAPSLFCSWGNYDRNAIREECARANVSVSFDNHHVNVKQAFARLHGTKRVGVMGALKLAGMDFEGTAHRAIDDAINISRLMSYTLKSHDFSDILQFVK